MPPGSDGAGRAWRAPDPRTTRLLAIGLPAAALALGAGVERSSACRAVVAALAGLAAASGVAVIAAARTAGVGLQGIGAATPGTSGAAWADPGGRVARVIVLVPARDEAAVIAGIIGDLASQQLPASEVEIVVVDDRSRDGTSAAAAAAVEAHGMAARARVVRRSSGGDGKGAALATIPLPATRDTAVVVLDADARVGPSFVAACVAAIERGSGVATARRRMLRPARGGTTGRRLAAAQDDEQLADDVVQRARVAMGGASELRGDGMVVRADILAELGGWGAGVLCEDLDLSARAYLATGRSAGRVPGTEVWEQPVLSVAGLVRQRVRWAEGLVRRDLAIVLPAQLDGTVPVRRRLDALAYALHALAPWVAAGLVVRSLLPGGSRARAHLGLLAAGYAAGGVAIAWEATGGCGASRPDRGRRIPALLTLESLWSVVLPIGWIRAACWPDEPRFWLTPHLPTAAFERPGNPDGRDDR